MHILHNSFQSLLAFLLWKCFSCRVRTFRWRRSRWSTWRFWSSQASSWCTSCATYYLMLLCPTPGSSWAPIRLLRFGGNTSSFYRAVHEIDKLLPIGPIIVHSEYSGEGVRLSYLEYWAYFAFYVILNILLIFNITKNSQAGFFEAKSRRILTISMWNICVYRIWNSLYGVRKGRYPCTCKEKQRTFLELLVTKTRTVVMDVGGGKWTAGPLDGGQAIMGINNQRHWNESCTQNMQNL